MKNYPNKKKIGLALGSGAARGCAHIGVLKALSNMGIEPDIICGSSMGTIVAASYAAGNLEKLEKKFCSFTKMQIAKFLQFDISLINFVKKKQLNTFFTKYVCDKDKKIEDLPKSFGAVSTLFKTGDEVFFSDGLVFDAIFASIAMPGLFAPFNYKGKWLIDGGLVNPIPISLCKKLGADIVIAVNLNSDIAGKHLNKKKNSMTNNYIAKKISSKIEQYSNNFFSSQKDKTPPNFINTILNSINIMQYNIALNRMKIDNPDIILNPKLSHIGLMEFNRAKEAIEEGEACVNRMNSEIKQLTGSI
ncbi:patatin-like phospholipase family protein [Candidatus Gracilibacteria bacterium]|nr:patatin-like phospholipase family protein [Candidatus Gracilibacteria bacterium]